MRTPLLLILLIYAIGLAAQDGMLDSTFAGDGFAEVQTDEGGSCVLLQPDGKYLVTETGFEMARLLTDGTMDTPFGPWGDGSANTALFVCGTPSTHLNRQPAALQPDGKFLVAGRGPGYYTFALQRFLPNGLADTSFGGDGLVFTPFNVIGGDQPFAVAVQPDGKILAAGQGQANATHCAMAVVRYNSDGTLDSTFSNDGKFLLDGTVSSIAYDMALQPDGRIDLVGTNGPQNPGSCLLVRLMPDGELDSTFNGTGKVPFSLSAFDPGLPVSMALLTDGRMFVGGLVNTPNFNTAMAAALFHSDGTSDTSFNGTGFEVVEFPATSSRPSVVRVQADGKLLIAGATVNSSAVATDLAMARLLADGTSDSTFGVNGQLVMNMTGGETINDVLPQSDGSIMLAGTISIPGSRLFVARLLSGLSPVDCVGNTNGTALPGTACNDGDANTVNDVYGPDCVCAGQVIDCLGVIGGTALVGTACDDGDPTTINDSWDINCVCSGYVPLPCQAMFNLAQQLDDDGLPIPNSLWLYNTSNGGSGGYTYTWDFGDGFTSTENTPVHDYLGNGPYWLCLTIDDGLGCTDTYCDSVSVDDNGIYSGVLGGGGTPGFTINVIDQTMGITELHSTPSLTIWPNPASDILNLTLVDGINGTATLTVTNMSGSVVRSQAITVAKGRNQLSMPIGELSDGLYMLRIGNASGYMSQRFVKMR